MNQQPLSIGSVRKRIFLTSGSFSGDFQEVDGTNILIALENAPPSGKRRMGLRWHPAGTVFVPNGDLGKYSGNKITHMAYTTGLYEAFRGGMHTVRHAGALPEHDPGEIQELETDLSTARAYVDTLLAFGMYPPEDERMLREEQQQMVKSYDRKRNRHKVNARVQFIRGLQLRDVLGRKNPIAAAFVNGAAIAKLATRQHDVRRITAYVDRRTIHLYGALQAHMDLYTRLRKAVKPHRDGANPDPQSIEYWIQPGRDGKAFAHAARRLRGFADAFGLIHALPFRKNAAWTHRDLVEAARLAELRDREGVLSQLQKVRNGIGWVFAQHVLEQTIVTPLSTAIEDIRSAERDARRRSPVKTRGRIQIRQAMAPERFAAIETALNEFAEKLARCSDEGLSSRVHERATLLIQDAIFSAKGDEWLRAKLLLKRASAML